MLRRLLVLVLMLLSAGVAWGQNPPPLDQAEQVRLLLERVQQLEKRVNELEAKQAAVSTAPTPTEIAANVPPAAPVATQPAAATTAVQEHRHDAQEAQAAVQQMETHYPSLQIRGFGDVDFSATDQKGTTSGFNLGEFVLHTSSALSKKVSAFGEIAFDPQQEGWTVDVERAILRYDLNDYFKLSFGRFHTPINYWNTAYHHGTWLQTTISRPEMILFHGEFLPAHFVGLMGEGHLPSGGANLEYNVGVGNGRSFFLHEPGQAGDSNNNRAWFVNIYSRPTRLYGLQFGGSVYGDKIVLADGRNFRELITSAHLVWTKGDPEFLAEFANVNHRNILTNVATNNTAFYVQVGYRLPWLEKSLKPYYRFEHTHTPLSEQVFTNMDLVGSIAGLRYDITSYAAFKAEYRNTKRQPGDPRVNGLFLQTDFTF